MAAIIPQGLKSYHQLEKVRAFFDSLCISLYGGCEKVPHEWIMRSLT